MTDFLESVRPVEVAPLAESVITDEPSQPALPTDPTQASVRQLLAELAHLEDVVRGASAWVDDAAVRAAMEREQVIIDELHRRNP